MSQSARHNLTHQRSYQCPSRNVSSRRKESSCLSSRPLSNHVQQYLYQPDSQETIAKKAFKQDQFEALGLQLKAKNSTISPAEQEQLRVLQSKMDNFWEQKLSRKSFDLTSSSPSFSQSESTATQLQAKSQVKSIFQARKAFHEHDLSTNSDSTLDPNQGHRQPLIRAHMLQPASNQLEAQPALSDRQHSNQMSLPTGLKAGLEHYSGIEMGDVKVHYDSPKPAQVNALAYAQAPNIYLQSGQEKHLPHEGWHIVQQKQGRVKSTLQAKGVPINDNKILEQEADVMGKKASQFIYDATITTNDFIPATGKAYSYRSTTPIQCMDDPDDAVYDSLRATHVELYKKYKKLSSIPKPSAVKKDIKSIVEDATDKQDAYKNYSNYIAQEYFKGFDEDFLTQLANTIKKDIAAVEKEVARKKRRREEELQAIRNIEAEEVHDETVGSDKEVTPPRKKPKYTPEQQSALKEKLKAKPIQHQLFEASAKGYQQHREKARSTIADRAKLNSLTEIQPLSTADMASAMISYEHGSMGDSLKFEKGKGYQVTMNRGGGEIIQQLGPYLPGTHGKSVQEILQEILSDTELNTRELAFAIDIRDPKDLEKFVKDKGVSDEFLGKIRALRKLREVEKARGPEVAGATALEHRSAVHGYSHIEEYPARTPLKSSKATTDIREARKRKREEKGTEKEFPEAFDYIPTDIMELAVGSTNRFLEKYMANPQPDKEAETLVEAILNADVTKDKPEKDLVDAMEGIMHTPEYAGFGGSASKD